MILNHRLISKEKEINDLKNKNNIIEVPKFKLEDIMVINFISTDWTVHYGVKCLSTDVFIEVEEQLYKKYDDLRKTNNMFTANPKPILRFKKLIENQIKDGDIIQLFKLE